MVVRAAAFRARGVTGRAAEAAGAGAFVRTIIITINHATNDNTNNNNNNNSNNTNNNANNTTYDNIRGSGGLLAAAGPALAAGGSRGGRRLAGGDAGAELLGKGGISCYTYKQNSCYTCFNGGSRAARLAA